MKRVLAWTLALLFCTGCACEHQFGEWTTSKGATCTAEGEQVRTCSKCDAEETRALSATSHNYGDWQTVSGSTCITEGVQRRLCSICFAKEEKPVAVIPHVYGEWKTLSTSTCTAAGRDSRVCVRCGAAEERDAALAAHTFGGWTVTNAASCTAEGTETRTCQLCQAQESQSIAPGHSWKDATCKAPMTCSRCGMTQGEKAGHAWKAATSVNPKRCRVCGASEGDALGMKIKDMSNSYLFYNSDVTIKDNGNGTVHFRVECMKGVNPKTSNIKMVGYDSAGNQTFTSVEPTYYVNSVFSYLEYKTVPEETVMIHLSDFIS